MLVLRLFQRQTSTGRTTPPACIASDSGDLMPGSDEARSCSPGLLCNLFACEHAGNLLATAAKIERLRAGFDGDSFAITARGFVKPEVRVRVRGHLRRMRYGQDLRTPPNRARRSPIADAVAPPTPVSISSKTRTGAVVFSARTTLSASRNRASSPPEATFINGPGFDPGLV